jgi:hypothetical protein
MRGLLRARTGSQTLAAPAEVPDATEADLDIDVTPEEHVQFDLWVMSAAERSHSGQPQSDSEGNR